MYEPPHITVPYGEPGLSDFFFVDNHIDNHHAGSIKTTAGNGGRYEQQIRATKSIGVHCILCACCQKTFVSVYSLKICAPSGELLKLTEMLRTPNESRMGV